MFPLGDDNRDRRRLPIVTWSLIALNVLVFVLFQGVGANERFTMAWSAVPAELVTGRDVVTEPQVARDPATGARYEIPGLQPTPFVWLTLLTAMFMHGGIAHLLGNAWFLFVFGDNVEDDMGRVKYLIFYLLAGFLASGAHVATTYMFSMNPLIPSLGASGAISGVLGAYMVLHPHRRVRVLMIRFVTEMPAWGAALTWFAFQVVSSLGMLGGMSGGVAYGAHIGGFLAGLVLAKAFAPGGRDAGRPGPVGRGRRGSWPDEA